jgi:serine phosphatase RsbU (regulator of sigma subunit)
MASLRFSTRAYAVQGDDPPTILQKLAELSETPDEDWFATMLIAEIDTATFSVRAVSAGHPPPLVVTACQAEFVELPPSPPVGAWGGARTPPSSTFELPAGAVLIAYTDGLVERRDLPLTEGMEQLRRCAIDPQWPVEQILDTIIDTLLPSGPVDDTAILAVRARPGAGPGRTSS